VADLALLVLFPLLELPEPEDEELLPLGGCGVVDLGVVLSKRPEVSFNDKALSSLVSAGRWLSLNVGITP
jgi:hypothetical protein